MRATRSRDIAALSAAGAISITLPIVIVILLFQGRIVSGPVQGAVKG